MYVFEKNDVKIFVLNVCSSGIFLLPHNYHLSGSPHPVTFVFCMHTHMLRQGALSCEVHVNTALMLAWLWLLGGLLPHPGVPLHLNIHHLLSLMISFVFLEHETDVHQA